jgi:hypothetical protein
VIAGILAVGGHVCARSARRGRLDYGGRLFTFESNSVRRAVRAGGRGRGRHDLRVLGQLKPFPVTRLEGGIVPQRALCSWAQSRRVSWSVIAFGRPRRTVGVEQRGEVRLVEPGGMLPDLPHDSPDRSSRLRAARDGVCGRAGAISVAVASLMGPH